MAERQNMLFGPFSNLNLKRGSTAIARPCAGICQQSCRAVACCGGSACCHSYRKRRKHCPYQRAPPSFTLASAVCEVASDTLVHVQEYATSPAGPQRSAAAAAAGADIAARMATTSAQPLPALQSSPFAACSPDPASARPPTLGTQQLSCVPPAQSRMAGARAAVLGASAPSRGPDAAPDAAHSAAAAPASADAGSSERPRASEIAASAQPGASSSHVPAGSKPNSVVTSSPTCGRAAAAAASDGGGGDAALALEGGSWAALGCGKPREHPEAMGLGLPDKPACVGPPIGPPAADGRKSPDAVLAWADAWDPPRALEGLALAVGGGGGCAGGAGRDAEGGGGGRTVSDDSWQDRLMGAMSGSGACGGVGRRLGARAVAETCVTAFSGATIDQSTVPRMCCPAPMSIALQPAQGLCCAPSFF